ncbi:tyrosine-type recombinase/integrase [Arthrobacter sp. PAMC25564]|uniref:tyrosine-type recombinase/integrase n=1 Tax=Arthrobacter sp. PAMC25564 TaxID=2565366 RepID=UPI001446D448|nr:tyrosine-type recombinase/integrase [Arthrobacter sp. PAMC25564]
MALTRFRDFDGVTRRVSAQGTSRAAADAALKEKLKARTHLGGLELTRDSTIKELSERWLPTLTQSQATQDSYRQKVDRYILPAMGAWRLWEATTGRCEAFLRTLQATAPSMASQSRVVLSLMMGLAVRYDIIGTNPVREVMMPTVEKRQVSALSVEQVQDLRRHIDKWAGQKPGRASTLDAMDMFLATGLRPGELLSLQFSDVDFRMGTIAVTGTVKRDSVHGLHRQASPKSESGKRVLTLPLFGLELLRRRKAGAAGDLVFPNRNGEPMEPANFRRLWREARGKQWEGVKPSSFRKAVATLIERESGSLIASRQLGHSSDAITKKHYIERNRNAPDSSLILEQLNSRVTLVH